MKLFETFQLGPLALPNRIVRSATYEKMADEDGFVTEQLIGMYEDLARGGAGLIITGNALVHTTGRSVPQQICIHNDFYVKKLNLLSDAVHAIGRTIVLQLAHGGRQSFPSLLAGRSPIAPSPVYEPTLKLTPQEMTHEEVWEMIDAFGASARRAALAGFDGVQIHAAHGYLANEFLSPHTNRRDDYWGGDEERRFHFLEEIIISMRKEAGGGFPVMIKLNAADFVAGGLDIDESIRIGLRLQNMDITAIEVSGGMYEAGQVTVKPGIQTIEQEAYFRRFSRQFKQSLQVPVMLVGGFKSRSLMEEVLQAEDADLISLSRTLVREPDLPNLMRAGKEKADCISCNGCMRFFRIPFTHCVALAKEQKKGSG
ncbi:MAG TPA: NADH:flavin oxidoreductase [Dissulfurispiraceae bacterium]|nr:NADH:flavin oxidoreductase [Dissulfurispiraceae bacterium]